MNGHSFVCLFDLVFSKIILINLPSLVSVYVHTLCVFDWILGPYSNFAVSSVFVYVVSLYGNV